jgi:hypothetical protein
VWDATVDGRRLTFHLSGINNQNFIMRDEETGSWWQQVSGEAIQGPLKGKKLTQIFHDELSFGLWKREQPRGRVLKPDPAFAAKYAAEDWERQIDQMKVVVPAANNEPLKPRELIAGVRINNAAKAYPIKGLLEQSPVIDDLGAVPLIIIVGDDRKSIRVFERNVDGRTLEFYARPGIEPLQLVDSQTGSQWDFSGKAVSGQLTGKQLVPVSVLKDFWFDWKLYNPQTSVYAPGVR